MPALCLSVLFAAAALLVSLLATARASDAPISAAEPPVVARPMIVVVKVPRPWYVPDLLIVRKMREAMPTYRAIPGLRLKAFTLASADGDFGGIYLWRDAAAAAGWFTPAWYARVRKERGVEAKVRRFSVVGPVRAGGVPAAQWPALDEATALIVSVPSAALGSDALIAAALDRADTRAMLEAYPIATGEGPGLVLFWRDAAAAERWLHDARPRLRALVDVAPRVERFEIPIVMPVATPASGTAPAAAVAGAR
jgi:hypothetical protein